MDKKVVAMKGYSTPPQIPKLEPHDQIQFSFISRTHLFGKGHNSAEDKVYSKPCPVAVNQNRHYYGRLNSTALKLLNKNTFLINTCKGYASFRIAVYSYFSYRILMWQDLVKMILEFCLGSTRNNKQLSRWDFQYSDFIPWKGVGTTQ